MHVFLVRHADAVEETLALRDPDRHLTATGRTQARGLGDRMRWHDCMPDHIWSSPLARALQTAELVAAGLHSDALVEIVPDLAPDGDVRAVVARLRALPPTAAVMIVGHEPGLSGIGVLLADDPKFEALAKAEAARIVDGKLRWRFPHDADAPVIGR
ncbi:MAG TPA: phosphohistidine phosphatase SixA [Kofleriaceae bacterium]|nr:phosphohistidine phosphatase SixA [Kofleriaceae bacterium]